LWHELAASALRADLQAQLGVLERDDVAAVLGAGWRAIAQEAAPWWTDVCLIPWGSLVEPIDGSERGRSPAPLLIVEVTEPQTSAFDRTERREAYAAGGCRWMVFVDPADPTIGRASSTIELLDLGDRHRVVATGRDHLRLADPLPLHIDLIEHGRLVQAVIEAEAAGEL
jgi:hypothetical protein